MKTKHDLNNKPTITILESSIICEQCGSQLALPTVIRHLVVRMQMIRDEEMQKVAKMHEDELEEQKELNKKLESNLQKMTRKYVPFSRLVNQEPSEDDVADAYADYLIESQYE